jgi:hypothetical protein
MASATQFYVDQYADYAMEQQRKYGIPASITLAQGIIESANGKSQLARNENNHFGVKATKSWLDAGGKYGLYTDDAKNEKFCSYASVGDSYEHHSKFLKNNSRYAACFKLSSDDYKGWANGLQRAGYATNKSYAQSLIAVIERNGLDKYDQMAVQGQYVASAKTETSSKPQSIETEAKTEAQPVAQSENSETSEYSDPNENWKKFLAAEDSSSRSQDPIVDMVVDLFAPLAAVATALDSGQADSLNASEIASRNFEQNIANTKSTNNLKLT